MSTITIYVERVDDFGKMTGLESQLENGLKIDTTTLTLKTLGDRVHINDVTDKELYNLQLKINEYLAEKRRVQREARAAV